MRLRPMSKLICRQGLLALVLALSPLASAHAEPQSTAFVQSLASAAVDDAVIADWYRTTGYEPLWTGADDADRRLALLSAISSAADHGLPVQRYDADLLRAEIMAAESEGDRGRVELAMTRAYLAWARDLTSGALVPSDVDSSIKREIAVIDPRTLLSRISAGKPSAVMDWLLPDSPAYLQLMKAKLTLETQIANGGWGATVDAGSLGLGDTGPGVVALRDRLMRMGYLAPTSTGSYDLAIQRAVLDFQVNHGLVADGSASGATITELNIAAGDRLKSVIVALERERWMDVDRSVRHIWVNLPDFHARIYEGGLAVFETRVVIGKNAGDQRSPEFSDLMEHMVINPSWGVPRSITVKEYLPLLQQNPEAVGHLQVVDGRGRVVSRGSVDFAAYSASSFPFDLRQPPSERNALGLVKFMFPNPYNIYLHDTPSKSLFAEDVRAYSHGCIRVARPFDLAYALLALQTDDPEAVFKGHLDSGDETLVKLDWALPVHLVYFTAYPDDKGRISYRRDVYGRDAAVFDALKAAGVVTDVVQG